MKAFEKFLFKILHYFYIFFFILLSIITKFLVLNNSCYFILFISLIFFDNLNHTFYYTYLFNNFAKSIFLKAGCN